MKPTTLKSLFVALLATTWTGCVTSPLNTADRSTTTPSADSKGALAKLEDSLLFLPTKFPEGNWTPRGNNWDRAGQTPFEDAWFQAADGTKLHGWYWARENPRAVVLFCHGNAGNLSDRADLVRYLHDQHQLTVMIFDYRGYGRSEGTPDEQGVLQDARAARAWLANRAGVAEKDIVLMGRSLGGAIAVDLAAKDGARGLILESTFTSVREVAAGKLAFAPLTPLMQNRFDSLSKISQYHGPLLQSHGNADLLIPYKNGLKLFEAANGPKRLVTIPDADHNHPQTPEYYDALDAFIDSLPLAGNPHRRAPHQPEAPARGNHQLAPQPPEAQPRTYRLPPQR